jgi:4-amino-4-deoxy-L-arabinose transferase-like glycosyltransferase
MSDSTRKVPSFRGHLALVLASAALVRVCFLWGHWAGILTGGGFLVGQPYAYLETGYAMAAGWGYVDNHETKELLQRMNQQPVRLTPGVIPPPKDPIPCSVHPPGLSLVVAGINRTLGIGADVPLQILGALSETLAAGIVFWIARMALGWKVGLWSGLLYAVFPPLAYISITQRPCALMGFCVASFLACALRAAWSSGWRAAGWLVLAGVVVGVGGYLRPDYLFVPAFTACGLWAYTRRFWQSAAAMAAVQMIALLMLFPWAYRNHQLFDRWIFTSTSVGSTMVSGLGEFSNPWGIREMDSERIEQAHAAGIANPWSNEGDLFFRQVFWNSVSQHPGAYLKLVAERLACALATPFEWGYENPRKTALYQARMQSHLPREEFYALHWKEAILANWQIILPMLFTLACSVSVMVMFLKERRHAGLILLLMSPHLYSIASHVLTAFQDRFLVPSMFCWIFALSYVLAQGWREDMPWPSCGWTARATPTA